MDSEIYSITLAAGIGTRMPPDMPPKPCCEIGPVSVIENALQVYEQAGVYKHLVVVGHQAERVMAEVCRVRGDVLFAFQPRPLGTGDAVRCALELLEGSVRPEHVLISYSDKVIAPHVMRGIVEAYANYDCDLCLLSGLARHNPGSGRLIVRSGSCRFSGESPSGERPPTPSASASRRVPREPPTGGSCRFPGESPSGERPPTPSASASRRVPRTPPTGGKVQAIIEVPDIKVMQLVARLRSVPKRERPGSVQQLADLVAQYVPRRDKVPVYLPALASLLDSDAGAPIEWKRALEAVANVPEKFDLPCGPVSVEEAAAAELCNLGLYIGRFEPLLEAVRRLGTGNVQGEVYFTDVVQLLAAGGREVRLFRVEEPDDVMAFNTIEELEAVRKVHAVRAQRRVRYPSLEAWNNHFAQRDPTGLVAEALRGLAEKVGADRQCIVARSPGRVNLMGRHVDHQGGMCNLMAIDHEIVLAASPRDDDSINLWNLESASYPARTFTFRELTADIVWEDWLRTLDLQYVQRLARRTAGDWAIYVMGAALRLQHRFRDRQLRGMDAFVGGNITVGAGLSSSSALVVAATEALAELNALNIRPREFVDLCGEGEWFVGTRGGSADHAAMKFGREEEVVGISFFPFRVIAHHPFPENCSLVVCHSGFSAKKTENARERFNSRVACYHMAREIIRQKFPQFAPHIKHLRDVNVRTLGISLPALYRLLKEIPLAVKAEEVKRMAERHPDVAKCVGGLEDLDRLDFPLRNVTLYGLAECERAEKAGEMLDQGDVGALGEMMNISHDGDRVVRHGAGGRTPFSLDATDERVDSLIERAGLLESLSASGAALWRQPGAYGCSTPEIDFMVDTAVTCEGALGAQLAGAGLGGCIMVLVRDGFEDAVQEVLRKRYYEPRGIIPQVFVCRPSRGSQLLTSIEAGA